jgi:hypothetical protein
MEQIVLSAKCDYAPSVCIHIISQRISGHGSQFYAEHCFRRTGLPGRREFNQVKREIGCRTALTGLVSLRLECVWTSVKASSVKYQTEGLRRSRRDKNIP